MWDTMCFTSWDTPVHEQAPARNSLISHDTSGGCQRPKMNVYRTYIVRHGRICTWTQSPFLFPFSVFCQNGCELFTRLKQLNGVCNTADILSAPPLQKQHSQPRLQCKYYSTKKFAASWTETSQKMQLNQVLLCIVLASSFFTLSLRSCRILIASNPRMAKSCSVTNGP